jgi:hypothetical protein
MPVGATTVTVTEDDAALVLAISGALDAESAALVRDAVAALIDADTDGRVVEVDLRNAAPLTVDGMRVVSRCAALGRVRFRFGAAISPIDTAASAPA